MERAKVEFVSFDSSDVIATSRIRYGFTNDGKLFRYSAKDVPAYNIDPNKGFGYVPDSRIDENDIFVYELFTDLSTSGNTLEIGGEQYSFGDLSNTAKWLFYNSVDNTWRLVNRSGQ